MLHFLLPEVAKKKRELFQHAHARKNVISRGRKSAQSRLHNEGILLFLQPAASANCKLLACRRQCKQMPSASKPKVQWRRAVS